MGVRGNIPPNCTKFWAVKFLVFKYSGNLVFFLDKCLTKIQAINVFRKVVAQKFKSFSNKFDNYGFCHIFHQDLSKRFSFFV